MIRMPIENLCSYYVYIIIIVFLLCFCIESPFEKIPQEPKIVYFLESDVQEELNGEKYVKRWWCYCVVLYSWVSFVCLYYAYVMLMFVLLLAYDIDKTYYSDDDVTLTQMVLQHTIWLSTEYKNTKDYEYDESYEDCVVMAEYLDDEENEDLDNEDHLKSKVKW